MKKKLLCMGLVAVFAVSALAFAGCGGEEKTAELENQLSAVQATVQTQKEELDALKKENAELQAQIDGLNGKVDELEKFINILGNKEAIGTFCDLSEAYEIGWLTKENIQHIVDHMDEQLGYPMEDKETESKILHDYKLLDTKLLDNAQREELTLKYYGEYNGCYVIRIYDPYGLWIESVYNMEVAGIKFEDIQPLLRVWKPKPAVSAKKTIPFEEQRIDGNKVKNKIERNILIDSDTEFAEKIDEFQITGETESLWERYDSNFFMQNSLILCSFWATDARIQREVRNIYINKDTLKIEIENLIPKDLILENGTIAINTDCFFVFTILQVQKTDISNIKEITKFLMDSKKYEK